MRTKVFGIGFPKTGTSSLGRALQMLGYRLQRGINVNRPNRPQIELPVTREKLFNLARPYSHRYDAFEDFPWMALYREMDREHPGSKFILTVRDEAAWLRSVQRHFRTIRSRPVLYLAGEDGPEASHEALFNAYRAHNKAVQDYFSDRPGDLLLLDVDDADWPLLCRFLGRREPLFRRYPCKNKAAVREWNALKKERGLIPALAHLLRRA